MRMYKYLYLILVMVILLLGCALYFTIVVPCMSLLLLLIFCIKKPNIQNSLFDKIEKSMSEIEDDYNNDFQDIAI